MGEPKPTFRINESQCRTVWERRTFVLRYLLKWVFARYVMVDADRLMLRHGFGALFVAQDASAAAGEASLDDHWSRVRAEIESRVNYRPW